MLSLTIIIPFFLVISTCNNFQILYLKNYYFVNQSIPKTIEIRVLCNIQKMMIKTEDYQDITESEDLNSDFQVLYFSKILEKYITF